MSVCVSVGLLKWFCVLSDCRYDFVRACSKFYWTLTCIIDYKLQISSHLYCDDCRGYLMNQILKCLLTEVFNFEVKLCLTLTIIFLSSIQRDWVGVEKDEKRSKFIWTLVILKRGQKNRYIFSKFWHTYFRRESGCNKHNILNIMKLVDCLWYSLTFCIYTFYIYVYE